MIFSLCMPSCSGSYHPTYTIDICCRFFFFHLARVAMISTRLRCVCHRITSRWWSVVMALRIYCVIHACACILKKIALCVEIERTENTNDQRSTKATRWGHADVNNRNICGCIQDKQTACCITEARTICCWTVQTQQQRFVVIIVVVVVVIERTWQQHQPQWWSLQYAAVRLVRCRLRCSSMIVKGTVHLARALRLYCCRLCGSTLFGIICLFLGAAIIDRIWVHCKSLCDARTSVLYRNMLRLYMFAFAVWRCVDDISRSNPGLVRDL